MILFRRIIPFLAPLLLFALYAGLWLNPTQWRMWTGLLLLTVLGAIAFLLEWKWRSVEYWAITFPALSLIVGGTGVLLFFESTLYQLFFVLLLTTLLGAYLENIFIFYYQPQRYSHLSIPNLAFFLLLFSLFAIFTTGFAIQFVGLITRWILILNIPIGIGSTLSQTILALVGFLFGGAVMAHMLWSYKLLTPQTRYIIPLFGLLCGQLMWILQFLPTAFFVNGMWITVVAYVVLACTQLHLRRILTRRLLLQYVVISIVATLIIVLTSRWT